MKNQNQPVAPIGPPMAPNQQYDPNPQYGVPTSGQANLYQPQVVEVVQPQPVIEIIQPTPVMYTQQVSAPVAQNNPQADANRVRMMLRNQMNAVAIQCPHCNQSSHTYVKKT